MQERVIVIGGDAAGMSAASQAKRLRSDELTVIGFECEEHSSYSAFGIPYWIAGDVQDEELLVVRSPEEHRRNGIDLRILTEVEHIDLDAGLVGVRELTGGRRYTEASTTLS
jgi:NADPH-dependent 2,4-dienoyl-CoA reductase/sulfur reductase-like enzyme